MDLMPIIGFPKMWPCNSSMTLTSVCVGIDRESENLLRSRSSWHSTQESLCLQLVAVALPQRLLPVQIIAT